MYFYIFSAEPFLCYHFKSAKETSVPPRWVISENWRLKMNISKRLTVGMIQSASIILRSTGKMQLIRINENLGLYLILYTRMPYMEYTTIIHLFLPAFQTASRIYPNQNIELLIWRPQNLRICSNLETSSDSVN